MRTSARSGAAQARSLQALSVKARAKRVVLAAIRRPALWAAATMAAEAARRLGATSPRLERRAQTLLHLKHAQSADWLAARLRALSPELTVQGGPFAGLRYPAAAAHGATLGPKILGTYEREIAPFFEARIAEASARGAPLYDELINIGSAEGYYAVGALRSGLAQRAIGFEISAAARAAALATASTNGVSDRYVQRGGCAREDLPPLGAAVRDRGARTLVLCDCEGGERTLFDAEMASALAQADLVIEVHEHLGASRAELTRAFAATHEVALIDSVSDRARADYAGPEAFVAAPLAERLLLAAELRAPMSWLVATARRAERSDVAASAPRAAAV